MKVKCFLSLIICVCMVLTISPFGGLTVSATVDGLNISGAADGYQKTINGTNTTITISKNGTYTISGSSSSATVTVNSGISASITLDNVTIHGIEAAGDNSTPALFNCGNITITLVGLNTLTGGNRRAGLEVPTGAILTINGGTDGTGSLVANSTGGGAGIGGRYYSIIGDQKNNSGSINISSGIITANGSSVNPNEGGAGIGGGAFGGNGTVNIAGGTVTAKGGSLAAGIGGGNSMNVDYGDHIEKFGGSGGTVNISGGYTEATGGSTGVGIGGGSSNDSYSGGNGANIAVTGGTLIAKGGSVCLSSYGDEMLASGIGAGFDSTGKIYGTPGHYCFQGGSINAKHTFGWSGSGKDIDAPVYNRAKMYADNGLPMEKVYLTTITIPNISTPTKLTNFTAYIKVDGSNKTYKCDDTKTDTNGKLYVYLPVNLNTSYPTEADIIVNNIYYNGNGYDYKPFYGTVDSTGTSTLKVNQCFYMNNKRLYQSQWAYYNYSDTISSSYIGSSSPTYSYTSKADSGASYSSSLPPSNAGDYAVHVTNTGDASFYPLDLWVYLRIQSLNISGYTLTLDKANSIYKCTGQSVEPGVTISDGTKTLTSSDYTVSYANNTGTALSTDTNPPTVTVTGKGNYTGSLSAKYTIEQAPLISVNCDTVNWATSQNVTITSQVGSSGLASVTVNDGTTTDIITNSYGQGYMVTKNGNYTFTVTDQAGYTASQSLTFNNIDITTPTISVSCDDSNIPALSDTLIINVTTGISGVHNVMITGTEMSPVTLTPTSADQTTFTFVAEKNMTYTFTVKNNAGTTASTTFDINNIDRTAPIVTGVKQGATQRSATISFNEGIATLNGVSFISGNLIDKAGNYTLVVIDDLNNTTTITFTINTTILIGDVNGDFAITTVDSLKVLQSVSGRITLTESDKKAADVNNDKNITTVDALKILQYVSGRIKSF